MKSLSPFECFLVLLFSPIDLERFVEGFMAVFFDISRIKGVDPYSDFCRDH